MTYRARSKMTYRARPADTSQRHATVKVTVAWVTVIPWNKYVLMKTKLTLIWLLQTSFLPQVWHSICSHWRVAVHAFSIINCHLTLTAKKVGLVTPIFKLFQWQCWGNFWEMGWSTYELSQPHRYHLELNWTELTWTASGHSLFSWFSVEFGSSHKLSTSFPPVLLSPSMMYVCMCA